MSSVDSCDQLRRTWSVQSRYPFQEYSDGSIPERRLRGAGAFEIQRRFYARINWRIEPISFEKEMRNTRLMGVFFVIAIVIACGYYWTNY